jgi:hypothetical protein
MSRKSVLLGTGILLLLMAGAAAGLVALVLREPGFYRRVAVPPGPQRHQYSEEFKGEFIGFINRLGERRGWEATFTQEQINSYLEEDFLTSNTSKQVLPDHVSDLRVALEDGHVRLGFRYHVGRWSTVVSLDMRVWLAAAESNVVALELRGIRAGSLPVSAQSLMERLTEAADRNNIKVSWYRHNGNPVALLRFQSDQPRSTLLLLDNLELHPGQLSIRGQSLEPSLAVTPAPSSPGPP